MKRFTIAQSVVLCLSLGACYKASPPPPAPAPRVATETNVPFDKSWEAVIAHFASNSVPIATLEKASGLIVTTALGVSKDDGARWAWCGWLKDDFNRESPILPNQAAYNVLVRRTADGSTLKVTVHWRHIGIGTERTSECVSKDVYEKELEAKLVAAAQGK